MSRTDKLLEKLQNGSINAKEARRLLNKLGWILDRQVGSHEQWVGPGQERLTLATHTKELKPYQIKEILKKVFK